MNRPARITLALGLASRVLLAAPAPPPSPTTDLPEGSAAMPDAPQPHQHTNRLAGETSPYLLQHAHNPVDWYPWGEEAFAEARRRQVPILVSIGYSTCYWCHVMERESFEDEQVAALMNERLVCIKVDREERPDVDDLYMSAVTALTGQGGWPLNVFLVPPPPEDQPQAWTALAPFWGGTYFPPDEAHGRPSWTRVVESLSEAWESQRDEVIAQSVRLSDAVGRRLSLAGGAAPIGQGDIAAAVITLLRIADRVHGGFGQAPKFPQPVFLALLMDCRDALGSDESQQRTDEALSLTLDRMAMGGMYDQVGGGFHRYSTDAQWVVPHFEKMLYDNGQLAEVYAVAAERTGSASYRRIADETCAYVLREMTDPAGGAFYSAQDAEVDGREGLNYLWTPEEVKAALEAADEEGLIDFAFQVFGLDRAANFRDPHHPDEPARHVLLLTAHPAPLAESLDLTSSEFEARLGRVRRALLAARAQRRQPRLDDKIIAGWNGLMIAGLARSAEVLGQPEYREAAIRAWRFIDANMRDESGGLLRTSRGGRAAIAALCEDYAFLAHGLLALHRSGAGDEFRDAAAELVRQARARFWDEARGGWFDTLAGREDLIFRARSLHDGAVPAAASVMLHNLIDLHERTGGQEWLDDALAALAAVSADVAENPLAAANTTRALLRLIELAPQRVHRIGRGGAEDPDRLVDLAPSVSEVDLIANASFEFAVTLIARDGWHINAHDPAGDKVVPLSFELLDGAGLALSPAYPPGTEFGVAGETIRVHEQSVTVPLLIRRVGPVTGKPRLVVTWQACNDRECALPVTEEVPVKLRVRREE